MVADGLPLFDGAQLAVDTTLVSPLHCDGSARPGASSRDGVALIAARRKKERAYPELVGPHRRARLVVLAGEVGGRSDETRSFISLLAKAKSRAEPFLLRRRIEQAWRLRWGAMLSCAAARAFAHSQIVAPRWALMAQPRCPTMWKGISGTRGWGKGEQRSAANVQSRGVGEPSPEGRERVVRLQAALDAMGNADDPEVQSLHEALRKAKGCVSRSSGRTC